MKIKRFKKKCIILSFVLILAGALISSAGFGIVGFNFQRLKKEASDDSWYQTIHLSDDYQWYGIDIGNDIHLFNIGNFE